ncbi:hypothetical protein AgCh_034011 [Apium graveolens]
MNRTKLPIRKRLGDVPQFSRSTDAAIAEMPKRFLCGSQGRVPAPFMSGSSGIVVLRPDEVALVMEDEQKLTVRDERDKKRKSEGVKDKANQGESTQGLENWFGRNRGVVLEEAKCKVYRSQ